MTFFKYMFISFLFVSILCFNPNQGVAGFPSLNKALNIIKEKKDEVVKVVLEQPESKIELKTTKDNFDNYETISVEFSGLSKDKKYGSTIVDAGTPNTEKGSAGLKVLSGRSKGKTGFSGKGTGHYEVRIYPEGSSQIIAKYPFTVGNPPPKTISHETKTEKAKESEGPTTAQPESKIELKTTKDNFDNYETISVEFSGLSKDKKYGSTIVEAGTPDMEKGKAGLKVLSGRSKGKTGFSGKSTGHYEIRIYPEGSSQIIAKYQFTVGNHPPKAVSKETKTVEAKESEQLIKAQPGPKIELKTTKDNFEIRETISVEFSGLSKDKKYGSTIVEVGTPDTEKGSTGLKVLSGRSKGKTGFSGQNTGHYEVRIYPEGSSQIIARYPFTVGNPPPMTASQSARPTGQKPKGIARTYFKSLEKQMQKLDELSQNANWNDPSFQNDFSLCLHGMNRDLKNVQSTDPDFDASEYTAKYADYKSLLDKKSAELEAESKPREDFIKYVKTKDYELKKLFVSELGSGADWVHSYYKVSDYYDKAMAIDYANMLKTVNEGVERFPDRDYSASVRYTGDLNVSKESVKEIREFGTKYETFYNETIHNLINEMIENAYSMKDSNANEAVKYAEKAKMLSDAALSLLPGNSKVADLNKDADATLNNVGGEIYAKIYTSDFHKKNAGKIVFFSSTPKIKSEDESTVKDAYKAGDFVYAMVYLKGSFKDLTNARNKIKIQIEIHVDGNEKASHEFVMDWETVKKNKSYLFMEIIPDPATNKHSGPAKFAKAISQTSPRKHEIKVVLKANTGSFLLDLAEGQFSLDCSSGQDKLKEYAAQYRNKTLAEYTMPDRKMKDKALEKSIIEALKNEGWENGKKIQRVLITGDAWEIFRHVVTGVILYRSIPVAAAFKTDDGECKYWNLTFKQGYNGKSYGKTEVGGVGSIVELSCDNVSK